MTPLHWAAFHNDTEVLKLLLENEAYQSFNRSNMSPVDLAGLCGKKDAVKVFADWFESVMAVSKPSHSNTTNLQI